MKSFLNIKEQIDANLELRGYTELTPVQKAIMENQENVARMISSRIKRKD